MNTGILLINLVEQMTGTKCQLPYKPHPSNRTFMIDNVSVALKYLSGFVSGQTQGVASLLLYCVLYCVLCTVYCVLCTV